MNRDISTDNIPTKDKEKFHPYFQEITRQTNAIHDKMGGLHSPEKKTKPAVKAAIKKTTETVKMAHPT